MKPGGRKQRENCVRMLTAANANVNALDMHGYSCLHYAAMLGWHDRYYASICCKCYHYYVWRMHVQSMCWRLFVNSSDAV